MSTDSASLRSLRADLQRGRLGDEPAAAQTNGDSRRAAARTADAAASWLSDAYYGGLSTEKQSSLDQLHQATNWGLSIVTTAVLVTIARKTFPDRASLTLLSVTLVVGWHYCIRALKGYANVMRYLLIQTGIIDMQRGLLSPAEALTRVVHYHRE